MDDLKKLSPEQFDHREWVALQWVRSYLVFEGAFPDKSLVEGFERLYQPRERALIFAVFKLMLFFNMLTNTLFSEVPAGRAD